MCVQVLSYFLEYVKQDFKIALKLILSAFTVPSIYLVFKQKFRVNVILTYK